LALFCVVGAGCFPHVLADMSFVLCFRCRVHSLTEEDWCGCAHRYFCKSFSCRSFTTPPPSFFCCLFSFFPRRNIYAFFTRCDSVFQFPVLFSFLRFQVPSRPLFTLFFILVFPSFCGWPHCGQSLFFLSSCAQGSLIASTPFASSVFCLSPVTLDLFLRSLNSVCACSFALVSGVRLDKAGFVLVGTCFVISVYFRLLCLSRPLFF